MKNNLLLFLIPLFFSSCEKKPEQSVKQTAKKETTVDEEKIYGDPQLNERYNKLQLSEEVNDSLKGHDFFNHTFKNVSCKCRIKKDYDNDIEGFSIRETEILIKDKINLSVLHKTGEKYIYTYNDKPFKIKNYFGTLFVSDSDIDYFFENRECYEISETQFLMREQPSRWCGLANQYDMYQIVDLNKMEMVQFAERDDQLK